jgi:hypothetical protein
MLVRVVGLAFVSVIRRSKQTDDWALDRPVVVVVMVIVVVVVFIVVWVVIVSLAIAVFVVVKMA